MVQLAAVYESVLAKNADLWAISPQDVAANKALQERRALPFPVLADADQMVICTWGLFNALDPKKRPIPYPATYVIAKNGRVIWRNLGLETRDRPTPAQIIAALENA